MDKNPLSLERTKAPANVDDALDFLNAWSTQAGNFEMHVVPGDFEDSEGIVVRTSDELADAYERFKKEGKSPLLHVVLRDEPDTLV